MIYVLLILDRFIFVGEDRNKKIRNFFAPILNEVVGKSDKHITFAMTYPPNWTKRMLRHLLSYYKLTITLA